MKTSPWRIWFFVLELIAIAAVLLGQWEIALVIYAMGIYYKIGR